MSVATTIAPTLASRLVSTELLKLIGNTPLIRMERIARDLPGIEIYGKAEFFNPGGSVKDRAALNMILDGERTGKLTRDKIILDSTSGNTGIAYAMIGAYKGYKVKLCLPKNASMERKHVLQAYGAEMVFTDPNEGSDGAIRAVREIYRQDPDRYFYPDQYNNPANWKAHYDGTGLEILAQTDGRITHFVACMGTSGTFMGNSRRFHKDAPRVLKHMPTAIVPGIYDPSVADDNVWIETEDAYAMCRRIAREEALLVGISSGANLVAARAVAKHLVDAGQSGVIVTMLCDGAYKYLSESFWQEPLS